ncbi:GDCCVxC domain-containing (seleno)protein [Cecembia calidifontis]|uniref:GDCCVxC domain-containing (seleno)protein n=1 Tax=Cecembia calidifontis TaxID=1187080 RepID=UPI001029ACB2|nr:GDCCVxC domain-containing (seleno)protein [Cecembia calidifontis]
MNPKYNLTTNLFTCPNATKKSEIIPKDTCQYFYECGNCKIVLRPKEGDSCLYWNYGTVNGPPRQAGTSCCK